MFIAKNIQKKYGKQNVLKCVDLTLQAGRCVGILGSNGSGKTTLLSIFAGVSKPDGGTFIYQPSREGEHIIDLFKNTSERNHLISYMPQTNPLFEELTVWDNLRLYFGIHDLKEGKIADTIKKLGVDTYIKKRVGVLSGGMKRRVTFCTTFVGNPTLLLLDEPTSALDACSKEMIYSFIKEFVMAGNMVLLVTHDVGELSICDMHYQMEDGVLKHGDSIL